MKVLLTVDTVGGVWTFGTLLARELTARGVEVVLATLGGQPSAIQRAQVAGLPDLSLFTSDFKLEWMDDPWAEVERSARWVLKIERETQPDVVHLNTFAHGNLPWRAPTLLTAHSCSLSWWQAVHGEAAPPVWNRYRRCVTAGLRAATLVTAPTRALLTEVQSHYGPLSGAKVVANGGETTRFHPAAKESFVLSAGRLWDEAKNIAAVAGVAADLPWPVYAAGECRSPDGGAFDAGGLRFLGQLAPADIAGWMSRASLFVSPARYEPFGLSILEAALSGCALVLGDIPSLREVWPEGAVFVSPDDGRALRGTLLDLIEDPVRRSRLAAAARHRALRFSAERMADQYLQLYRSLTSRRKNEGVRASRDKGRSNRQITGNEAFASRPAMPLG